MNETQEVRLLEAYLQIISLLVLMASFVVITSAQDDVIRIDTSLVTIPASVVDRNGRNITNLQKEDFQIFEDGVEQEIEFFAPVEKSFTILFLLDVSPSMTYRMGDLANAANTFLGQLRPDDKLVAVSFCEQVTVLNKIITAKELLESNKLRLKICPNTNLYDAVDFAVKNLKKIQGRKAIVLFSDGYGSGVFATAKENLRDVEELDILIFPVQFNTLNDKPPRSASKRYFKIVEDGNS
jgi:Ca-activated chloride channel family protein